MPGMAYSQTFKHYEGIANKKGDYNWNGTQKCHELTYYYYVTKEQNRLVLTLPLADYTGDGSDTEPRGYYRWYDWKTDAESSRLTKVGLRLYRFDNGKGLYALCLKENPDQNSVGVTYSPPSETEYDSWEADTIACDVSRYHDGIKVYWWGTTNFGHEPTLSIRYKFVIRKASWIADQLRKAVVDSHTGTRTFEDNQDVTIGINSTDYGKSEANLRLNYNNVKRYYFYPLTDQAFNNKHIYYQSGKQAKNKFEESDFGTTPTLATDVKWRVYDETNTYYCDIDAESQLRFVKISPYKLNDRDWTHITTGDKVRPGSSQQLPKFKTMSRFNVVAYLGASNQWCPVANFSCRFAEEYPVLFDDLNTGAPTRTLSYIEDHYVKVTEPISFDNLSDGMTYDAPTKENNVAPNPSKWELRHYGFVYKKLVNDSWSFNNYAPVHGEYGVYKTAGVSGISNSNEGYKWWYGDNMNFYDRTYGLTTGKQAGYFLYVDASDESREIASAEFTANLCSGTTFIVSAAIADLTLSGQTAPQVMFKLYGDNGDRVVRQENLIHSFASCDMKTVVNNYRYGKWYQVYAKVTLRDSENLRKFQKFLVTVDNYCPSTSGADYAVDDIRFYQKRAIVDVIQNQPVCDDVASAASVKLKLRAVYESLQSRALVDRDGKSKVYYRFVDEKGEPVECEGIEAIKVGLLVQINSLRGFIPLSQGDLRFVHSLSNLVGKKFMAKILEVDRAKNRLVLSRKAVLESQRDEELKVIEEAYNNGDTLQGTVKKIMPYGAFVGINGVEGLLHISDISWKKIGKVEDVLQPGQVIDVKIKSYDPEKQRISFTHKECIPNPWETSIHDHDVDDVVDAKVVKILEFGAIVELDDGLTGLLHINEMTRDHNKKPSDIVAVGDVIKVRIIGIDEDRRRISFSLVEAADHDAAEDAE